MSYVTRTEIENQLNITLEPSGIIFVESILPMLSALIDTYCDRTWPTNINDEIVEQFDGTKSVFFVAAPPIASIVSVKTNVTGDYSGDLVTEYYQYKNYIELPHAPKQSVSITYKTAAAFPGDIKLVLIRWIGDLLKSQQSESQNGGVSKVKFGSAEIQYTTTTVTPDDMPSYLTAVLDRHRILSL